MSKNTDGRIFRIDFDVDMACPHCKETIDSVIEIYSHKKQSFVSRYNIAFVCPKCKTILSITKAET